MSFAALLFYSTFISCKTLISFFFSVVVAQFNYLIFYVKGVVVLKYLLFVRLTLLIIEFQCLYKSFQSRGGQLYSVNRKV